MELVFRNIIDGVHLFSEIIWRKKSIVPEANVRVAKVPEANYVGSKIPEAHFLGS